jgi:hypothetical protein
MLQLRIPTKQEVALGDGFFALRLYHRVPVPNPFRPCWNRGRTDGIVTNRPRLARNSKVHGKTRLVPHVIALMLLGSKGEKRRAHAGFQRTRTFKDCQVLDARVDWNAIYSLAPFEIDESLDCCIEVLIAFNATLGNSLRVNRVGPTKRNLHSG